MTFWKQSSYDSESPSSLTGFAWDLTMILIALHVVSTLLCVFFTATGHQAWLQFLLYSPMDFHRGYFGSLFLYPFYHDIAREHIWFAVEMVMFFWFGREVEKTVGKWHYGILYGALVCIPPLLMFAFSPWLGTYILAGSNTVHFTMFLAFVILYPQANFFFGFSAKWLGIIFFGIAMLAYVSQRQWAYLFQLCSSLGLVWIALPWMKGTSMLERFANWKTARAENKLQKKKHRLAKAEEDFNESVDHILEKISREGMQSLTSSEREKLERARTRLLKKDY
ncbi:MAG: DUF6576 domain-containing protein [Verrucomicrobiota bacterium]